MCEISFVVLLPPQMVALWKDPNGEIIFNGENVFNGKKQFVEEQQRNNGRTREEAEKSNDTIIRP